jgi:hypothetical protein
MSALSIRNMNWATGQRDLEKQAPQTGETYDPKERARILNERADELQALGLLDERERRGCWSLADLRKLVEAAEKLQ